MTPTETRRIRLALLTVAVLISLVAPMGTAFVFAATAGVLAAVV